MILGLMMLRRTLAGLLFALTIPFAVWGQEAVVVSSELALH